MATIWRSSFRRRDPLLLRSLFLRPFRSSSSTQLVYRNGDNDVGSENSAYDRALKFQRPSTIKYQQELKNSVSLIGEVVRPIRELNGKSGDVGANTVLKVKSSSESTHIWILLTMWGEMAKICTTHLKLDDFIYVSGRLGSYSKADENGIHSTIYKVNVMKINYVQLHGKSSAFERAKQSRVEDIGETSLNGFNNRLYLWQVFFASPYEWYDCRKSKKTPNHPDFKHKDTGEVLWLKRNDPPWVRKQLELQDSRLAGSLQTGVSSHLTPLVYDDLW